MQVSLLVCAAFAAFVNQAQAVAIAAPGGPPKPIPLPEPPPAIAPSSTLKAGHGPTIAPFKPPKPLKPTVSVLAPQSGNDTSQDRTVTILSPTPYQFPPYQPATVHVSTSSSSKSTSTSTATSTTSQVQVVTPLSSAPSQNPTVVHVAASNSSISMTASTSTSTTSQVQVVTTPSPTPNPHPTLTSSSTSGTSTLKSTSTSTSSHIQVVTILSPTPFQYPPYRPTTVHVSTSTSTQPKTSSTSTKSTRTSTTTSHVYSCVPSPTINNGKRGLAYNNPAYTNEFSLSCGNSFVSWAYDWSSSPGGGFNPALRYIPLLWSDASDLTSVWTTNVNNAIFHNRADALLAFNEPDLCYPGSACMSVSDAVASYKEWVQPFAGRIRLGSPAVSSSSAQNQGLSWLSQFLTQCTACRVDFLVLHYYGDVNYPAGFQNYIASAHAQFPNYPIWVTEFGTVNGNQAQVQNWLQQNIYWLDQQSYVERYAYFMDAAGDTFLIDSNGDGKMNSIGQMYNSLP